MEIGTILHLGMSASRGSPRTAMKSDERRARGKSGGAWMAARGLSKWRVW